MVYGERKNMCPELTLSDELVQLVELRMKSTIEGIEETLQRILESHEISIEELKEIIHELEESFSLLSEKWNLQILFILFLRNTMGFSNLKKVLNVNSRTLSDKLKSLQESKYIERSIDQGPPLRVKYSLTIRGRNTILLALPLLYYYRTNP
jgi:DNA-binding HxlR family transcriptional regulator